MASVCPDAEADRNDALHDVLSEFRAAEILLSYASYGQCQYLDANGRILLAREVLSEPRAAVPTASSLFRLVERFIDSALTVEVQLTSEFGGLSAGGEL